MEASAFIERFIKLAAGASTRTSSPTAMAEAVVKRPDLRPQNYTQKNPPGGATDPTIGAQQKNTPPPPVWGT